MSGAEAIGAIQLIDACIGITKTIIDIGRAVHNAQGLPPKLSALFEQVPVIEDLLERARDNCEEGKITQDTGKSAEPILKQCEHALGELRDIFRKACPKDGDDRAKRIWRGTRAVFFGRGSKLQELLALLQDNLKLLEQKEIYIIGDKLDDLQQLTEEFTHDDTSKNVHYGSGHNFANEGGKHTYNMLSGQSKFINKPGVYNEGSTTYHTHLPPERPETPPKPSTNMRFTRDDDFVERKALTDQLNGKLSKAGARAALVGLGGVGHAPPCNCPLDIADAPEGSHKSRLSTATVFESSHGTRGSSGSMRAPLHDLCGAFGMLPT